MRAAWGGHVLTADALGSLWPAAPQLAAFALAVLVLNATPGVDLLLTLTRTWQHGLRAGVAAALGIATGCAVHVLAAALGLAALLALYPRAFVLLQWAGAAYLAWLGLQMLRGAWRRPLAAVADKPPSLDGDRPVGDGPAARPPRRLAADFRTGLFTNLLNPKVAFFILAFLPPFVPAASPHKTLSFLLLGLWFVLQGALFLLVVAWLAARLAGRGAGPQGLAGGRWQRPLQALGGFVFIALAWRVLKEKQVLA